MIKKDSLKMNVYEYFEYCHKRRCIRLVSVITDKQMINYSQIDKEDLGTHPDMLSNIEEIIHPNIDASTYLYQTNELYLYSIGDSLIISLPEDKQFSMNQYLFLEDVLNQVEKFNNDYQKKISVVIFDTNALVKNIDSNNISEIKATIKSIITKDFRINNEVIIGHELDYDTKMRSMIYHISLDNAKCIGDIISSLKRCYNYYNDKYYKEMLNKIFPDYEEISYLIRFYDYFDLYDVEVNNVSFDNIKDILYDSFIAVFDNKTDEEIEKIINDLNRLCLLDTNKAIISKLVPNLDSIVENKVKR